MLRNPYYAGFFWGVDGKLTRGSQPELVSPEVFVKVWEKIIYHGEVTTELPPIESIKKWLKKADRK
jgi:hypothetical protein